MRKTTTEGLKEKSEPRRQDRILDKVVMVSSF